MNTNEWNKGTNEKMVPPVLVVNPDGKVGEYLNVAPMLESLRFIDSSENRLQMLGEFLGNLGKIIATTYMKDDAMIIEGYDKEYITYVLFHLEEGCKKCTVMNC
jgi:hypothetical protein